jgi:hypothetical protein
LANPLTKKGPLGHVEFCWRLSNQHGREFDCNIFVEVKGYEVRVAGTENPANVVRSQSVPSLIDAWELAATWRNSLVARGFGVAQSEE